jgi:hypothetical protein
VTNQNNTSTPLIADILSDIVANVTVSQQQELFAWTLSDNSPNYDAVEQMTKKALRAISTRLMIQPTTKQFQEKPPIVVLFQVIVGNIPSKERQALYEWVEQVNSQEKLNALRVTIGAIHNALISPNQNIPLSA